jgi:Protein of unknown function TPD sequence-motif
VVQNIQFKNDKTFPDCSSTFCLSTQALFGDADTHRQSVLPQCESYVHRFGPGMILYFFGHAPLSMLGDGNGDLVIMGWELPKTFMWPTGALSSDNST